MINDPDKLTIGGYAQVDYNQKLEKGKMNNGNLDVHRLVLLFGYKFNNKVQFITEIELEHVSEVYVEQAFLEYKLKDWIKFRGGLILVPMGIINEYHEPPTFNGVERPSIDTYIVPTTWRDIGVGATGIFRDLSLKYQVYVINGLLSYNGNPRLNGTNGIRGGRQKGLEALSRVPAFAGKVEYYGVKGLNVGLSAYTGQTQSTLFDNIPSEGPERIIADSSIVNVSLLGLDARYSIKGFMFRGQFNYGWFSNTLEYNAFTGSDLGSSMIGYYLEAGYNVLTPFDNLKSQLILFLRYENYNTQNSVTGGIEQNPGYHRQEYTFGLGWKPVPGAVVKVDYQLLDNKALDKPASQLNMGIGVWF